MWPNIALISDSFVIVADRDGNIQYATDGSNIYTYHNAALPANVVDQVINGDGFAGLTTLGGIYAGQRYTAGLPINVSILGRTVNEGLVLVSVDASNLAEMWSATATIFFFSAVVVLLISVVASTLTSAYQARPLNEMGRGPPGNSARGDFDVRVTGYEGRCDEISTLAEGLQLHGRLPWPSVESQRSEFIANVSHELKTPMTTISGFAEGILDGTIPPGAGEGVPPDHRVRDPAAVPAGAPDAGPVPAQRPGGDLGHRPGDLRPHRGHVPGAHQPGGQDHQPQAGRGRADAPGEADGVGATRTR